MATVNTTWTSPASATLDKATGATIDETMTDAWSSNLYNLGGTAGYIGARVYHAATQSATNGTPLTLAFNSERVDSDPNGAIHDTVTNNSRLTVRTGGLYLITGTAAFASNATGYRSLSVLQNGANYIATQTVPAISGNDQCLSIATVYLLSASDYVELQATQTSGGALNVQTASAYSPEFTLTKV